MEHAERINGLPLPAAKDRELLPDFLVIAPPKTGSTWLAANLNCHPEIFIPDIKEIHYFNHYLFSKGWDWYAEQLRPGLGLTKGEATPGYCLMLPETIQLIRALMPKLKLIYLVREPVGRAWSHARHCFRHRHTTFEGYHESPDQVPDEKWIENVTDLSSIRAGQVLEHLKSWLAFFPKDQILIDFYPSLRTEPTKLLKRIFKFLGVSTISDFSFFQISQKLNEGLSRRLSPSLNEFLRQMFAPAAGELAAYLREEFNLALPAEWGPLLRPAEKHVVEQPVASAPGPVKAIESYASTPPARTGLPFPTFEKSRLVLKHTPRTRDMNYFGYHLVYYKGMFFGVAHEVGFFDLRRMSEKEIVRLEGKRLLYRSPLLEWVKLQITDKQLAPLYRGPRKRSIVIRAPRYFLRRMGTFASAISAKIQALSPRVVAQLKPAPAADKRRRA